MFNLKRIRGKYEMKQHTQEIRQRVLESAKELLIEQGYKKTTIRSIVERSGVLTGSIYYFFKNKEAIFAEMLESIIHQCIEKIDTCCEGETAAFKFAVLCEVELKKMQDDPPRDLLRVLPLAGHLREVRRPFCLVCQAAVRHALHG